MNHATHNNTALSFFNEGIIDGGRIGLDPNHIFLLADPNYIIPFADPLYTNK